MQRLDDFNATELGSDIRAILSDPELDDEEKIVALMELPDPTMDEARAERIVLCKRKSA